MKPLVMEPIPDYTIWGNDRVSRFRHADKNYGTWWEVSAHPYCTNRIANLPEKTLQEVIDADMEGMLGPGLGMHEMLRLAMLDAKDDLSIQVHPDDAHAPAGDFGKAESWYIIHAEPGATLVAGTTESDPAIIRQAVEDGTVEDHLQKIEMHTGDFIYIPTGLLHALGKGIHAIEVGTNSNTTFRFYDYNRTDAQGNPRQLHIAQSFESADFSLEPVVVRAQGTDHLLIDADQFSVVERFVKDPLTLETGDTYFILTNLGEDTSLVHEGETIPFGKWQSVFVPWNAKSVTLHGGHILESRPKK